MTVKKSLTVAMTAGILCSVLAGQGWALTPVTSKSRININQANATTLAKLKGIGPKKADAIVRYRGLHGKFAHPSDLTKVKGISAHMVNTIEQKNGVNLTVNNVQVHKHR